MIEKFNCVIEYMKSLYDFGVIRDEFVFFANGIYIKFSLCGNNLIVESAETKEDSEKNLFEDLEWIVLDDDVENILSAVNDAIQ